MKKYIILILLAYSSTNIFCMETSESENDIQEAVELMDAVTNLILSVHSSENIYKKAILLCAAARVNNVPIAKKLLDTGLSPNIIPFDPISEAYYQYAPIHLAALYDKVEMLEFLISAKALLNAGCAGVCSDAGYTALCIAVSKNNIKSVKILVEAGADVNSGLPNDKPILIAARMGHTDILKYIVELRNSSGLASADLNAVDNKGYAAIHHAAKNGNLEAVKILIKAGISFNKKDNSGNTAVDLAIKFGRVEVQVYLRRLIWIALNSSPM